MATMNTTVSSSIDRLLVVLLLCSVGYNVLQAWPSSSKRGTYDSTRLTGRSAPPIRLMTQAGEPFVLDTAESTLLYVLRPGCTYCEVNTDNMVSMWEQIPKDVRVIGVSLGAEGLDDYLREYPLPFEIHVLNLGDSTNKADLSSYGFGATPALYMLRDHKIERAWGGALANGTQADVEKVLNIKIPGAVF
jgi:hypothetical protein